MRITKLLSYFQTLVRAIDYLFNRNFSEEKLLKKIIDDNSVVVDIGSNLGSFIKLVSKLNKNKSVYFYSIEPIKQLNFEQNKIVFPKAHNLKIINKAVIDSNQREIEFFERFIYSHSSINEISNEQNVRKYTVEAVSFMNFIYEERIEKIDLLKIDTEGLDFKIIKSIDKKYLKNNITNIKAEITHENIEILNYLFQLGFNLIGINNISYKNNQLKLFDGYFSKSN